MATVDRLLATIEANPIASVTLAMLLRGAESRSLGAGLVAESSAYSLLQAGPEFERWLAGWNRRERPPEAEPPVLVHRNGDCLELTLNRPHVRNALDRSMRDALLAALAIPLADPSVATVDVSGRGPAFCSGGDLDDFGSFEDPANAHVVRLGTSIGRAIDAVRDRVTVRMHGSCAGSGVELPGFAGSCCRCCGYAVLVAGDRIGTDSGRGRDGEPDATHRPSPRRAARAQWVGRRCRNRALMGTRRRGRVVARLAGRATDGASRLCRESHRFRRSVDTDAIGVLSVSTRPPKSVAESTMCATRRQAFKAARRRFQAVTSFSIRSSVAAMFLRV